MSTIFGPIPYFRCLARREYTRDLEDRHGEWLACLAIGVRCIRGHSLWFQVVFTGEDEKGNPTPTGGAMYMLPIQALAWKPCKAPDQAYIQPWDVFSWEFGVCELPLLARGRCEVLPDRRTGRYRFTIDFAGTDLAEDPEQHKHLHVVFLDQGQIGAFPNNRLLMQDPAFWEVTQERPDFVSLGQEFRGE